MTGLWWEPPGYEGDRRLARVGELAAGAVFPPAGGKYWRWRCWMGTTLLPSEGAANDETAAKAEVEKRFNEMLRRAGLRFREVVS